MAEEKRGRGRPPITDEMRQQVRDQLWSPGLRPVSGEAQGLPEVFLPNPPAKKGTQAYAAWRMECFIELVRHGYNFSQAAEKLGTDYQWWYRTRKKHPEWEAEVLEAAKKGGTAPEYPDLTNMSFPDFCYHYGGFTLAKHQLDINEAIVDPMAKKVLILGHPESGKSTLVSLWLVLYKIAQNPDIRIALVSKSSSRAQDLLNRVKRYLTEPHLYEDTPGNLVADFNGFKPPHGDLPWSQDQIYIRQRVSGERDPTVQALGIGKQIYGARLDLLILDDALVMDNQISETTRNRIDEWFTNEALSRVQKGQAIVNGTRLVPFDLYGQWKKSWEGDPLFRGVYIPAILDEWTEDERPMWPEYWDLDGKTLYETIEGEEIAVGYQQGLRDIRRMIMSREPDRWRLVYQQEDVEESDNIFRADLIDQAYTNGQDRSIGQVMPGEILYLGVDPAPSGRAASVLIAYDPVTQIRTVVDLYVGTRLGATGILQNLMYHFWEKYKSHGIGTTVVETNFAPTLMADEAFMSRAEAMGITVVEHTTTSRGKKRGSKHDEEFGVGAMVTLLEGNIVAFPSRTATDREYLRPLVEDMLTFPWGDQQDALMAFWFAETDIKSGVRVRVVDQSRAMIRRNVPPNIRSRR